MKKFFKIFVVLVLIGGLAFGGYTIFIDNFFQGYEQIELDLRQVKTTYGIHEEFSPVGLKVFGVEEDGSKTEIKKDIIINTSEFDNTTIGTYNIVVSYLGASKSFPVTVTTDLAQYRFDVMNQLLNTFALNKQFGIARKLGDSTYSVHAFAMDPDAYYYTNSALDLASEAGLVSLYSYTNSLQGAQIASQEMNVINSRFNLFKLAGAYQNNFDDITTLANKSVQNTSGEYAFYGAIKHIKDFDTQYISKVFETNKISFVKSVDGSLITITSLGEMSGTQTRMTLVVNKQTKMPLSLKAETMENNSFITTAELIIF